MSAISLRWLAVVLLCSLSLSLSAQTDDAPVHYVRRRSPVQGLILEQSADRRVAASPRPLLLQSTSPAANAWRLQATLPGAVIHDLSFPTSLVGYAVAELGQVWKTTDGGSTWTEIMNLGFPYYWEGVAALTPQDIVISGLINNPQEGIIRWSHDGGATWTPDIILNSAAWSYRIRFADLLHGLVIDPFSPPNAAHYTTDGGATAADWTQLIVDPKGAWFGNQFSLLPNLHARVSGITYCTSQDGGVSWNCRPSIDPIFDGEVFFVNDDDGWVGSGTISPTVQGWVHRTTDGGNTWSGRTLNAPWPIRQILFVTPTTGWAAGGNIYSNVGGIYFSSDGGQSWSLDVDSNGHEMDACDSKPAGDGFQIWCAGYNNIFNGVVYTLQIAGAAMPTFSPAPGAYNASQSVTLADTSPGASIYFTTDGSTPTAASAAYTAPITVSGSTTIQAIAIAPGYLPSAVAAGSYVITPQLQVSPGSPSVTVQAGQSAIVPLTVGATATVASSIAFSCSGLPVGGQCVFSPDSLNAGPLPANVSLTITTSSTMSRKIAGRNLLWMSALLLPGLLLMPLAKGGRRRIVGLLVGMLLLLIFAAMGCGGGTPTRASPSHYMVTVTATANGATPGTAQLQLTINP